MAALPMRVARQCRSFSTAPASAINVDWALIRNRMLTDEARSNCDKKKEIFQRRLSAARGVMEPSDLDWAHYKAKLPELDIDAIRADYEKVVKSIPAIVYDEAADIAEHEEAEKAWDRFSRVCLEKVEELKVLAAEQADHKLHRWYRRSRIWQRFPGLYEEIHHKVRGTWDKEIWGNYIAYKARAVPLPWDASSVENNEERKKETVAKLAERLGTDPKLA